ncbi:hypothetical protein CH333_00045 [candidate division WOR-3 bacterium JGI_Cruoil_03_44_89]|uniref:Phosphatidic acid phosphatase type 2/haloperoxidase domain-containing protein n=1 Tax=candidate division WOR-3 bacterium JGI_Cruoil_03_44_89 TaxID=1973748 RepID=A0A235C1G3_UNCW3|nr:MAG: hypothetical protein CH333_00045 [candidate division WOR-3 bacterium JGI_Cruoil_03_44_89]
MFFILIICSIPLQNDSIRTWDINSLDYWEGICSDGGYVLSSPVRWSGGDWLKCGLFLGTTGGLMCRDEEMRDWFQRRRSSTSNRISSGIEPLGAEGAVVALGTVYLSGCLLHDAALKRTALLCGESALVSGVVVGALKILAGRARPYKDEGAYSYSPFNICASYQSLPSGHTSTAFAIASCLADDCENKLVGVMCYGMAILVGLARIHDNEHWISDVFLGGVIGIGVGKTISKLHGR